MSLPVKAETYKWNDNEGSSFIPKSKPNPYKSKQKMSQGVYSQIKQGATYNYPKITDYDINTIKQWYEYTSNSNKYWNESPKPVEVPDYIKEMQNELQANFNGTEFTIDGRSDTTVSNNV